MVTEQIIYRDATGAMVADPALAVRMSRYVFDDHDVLVLHETVELEAPLAKADVKNPGSRGGVGYYDEKGHWIYGSRPVPRAPRDKFEEHLAPYRQRAYAQQEQLDPHIRAYEETGVPIEFERITGEGKVRVTVLSKRPTKAGGHRLTNFDERGPYGHTEHDTLDDAIRELRAYGAGDLTGQVNQGYLDRWSTTPEWKEGLHQIHHAQVWNERRAQWHAAHHGLYESDKAEWDRQYAALQAEEEADFARTAEMFKAALSLPMLLAWIAKAATQLEFFPGAPLHHTPRRWGGFDVTAPFEKPVQHPGSRGGRFRITPKGQVRYDLAGAPRGALPSLNDCYQALREAGWDPKKGQAILVGRFPGALEHAEGARRWQGIVAQHGKPGPTELEEAEAKLHSPASIAASLDEAARRTAADRARWRVRANALPDGTTINGWVKHSIPVRDDTRELGVRSDIIWVKKVRGLERGTPDVTVEVGEAAVEKTWKRLSLTKTQALQEARQARRYGYFQKPDSVQVYLPCPRCKQHIESNVNSWVPVRAKLRDLDRAMVEHLLDDHAEDLGPRRAGMGGAGLADWRPPT